MNMYIHGESEFFLQNKRVNIQTINNYHVNNLWPYLVTITGCNIINELSLMVIIIEIFK